MCAMWVGWVAMFGMSQWHTRRSTFQEEANHLALSPQKKKKKQKEVNACCKFRSTSRALILWRGQTFSGGHLSWQSKHGTASFEEGRCRLQKVRRKSSRKIEQVSRERLEFLAFPRNENQKLTTKRATFGCSFVSAGRSKLSFDGRWRWLGKPGSYQSTWF